MNTAKLISVAITEDRTQVAPVWPENRGMESKTYRYMRTYLLPNGEKKSFSFSVTKEGQYAAAYLSVETMLSGRKKKTAGDHKVSMQAVVKEAESTPIDELAELPLREGYSVPQPYYLEDTAGAVHIRKVARSFSAIEVGWDHVVYQVDSVDNQHSRARAKTSRLYAVYEAINTTRMAEELEAARTDYALSLDQLRWGKDGKEYYDNLLLEGYVVWHEEGEEPLPVLRPVYTELPRSTVDAVFRDILTDEPIPAKVELVGSDLSLFSDKKAEEIEDAYARMVRYLWALENVCGKVCIVKDKKLDWGNSVAPAEVKIETEYAAELLRRFEQAGTPKADAARRARTAEQLRAARLQLQTDIALWMDVEGYSLQRIKVSADYIALSACIKLGGGKRQRLTNIGGDRGLRASLRRAGR